MIMYMYGNSTISLEHILQQFLDLGADSCWQIEDISQYRGFYLLHGNGFLLGLQLPYVQ